MAFERKIMALDVGEKRIGVALADAGIRIAVAHDTVLVDGDEVAKINQLIEGEAIDVLVVGYPRNQSGETTAQTIFVEKFADNFRQKVAQLVFQDESLTSVKAEELLTRRKRPYQKVEVDALAASLILQDYLEASYGRI